ncbi:hypothetical protein FEM48_Zijuj01G0084000 [Ziziphus jujuba var. spinosa]|uniref:Cation-transporting P-type ATPase C-terminal domain-containing protein n=1 Tax=Ziziphus jujuba var. spinosa TaxID=714518 RepID=A0A978W063_ZIZJJ|nr:hypothetical protein FEM48_Zijuj01G0084000 [Ziziphus jujuba var. spinosa]
MCSHYYDRNGEIKDMDENKRGAFKHIVEGMQSDHLRTVAFAYKAIGVSILQDNDLILVGILGLKNTCCTERTDAISACQNAGVKIILASEDDISVLENVAHKCGLMLPNSDRLQGNVVAVVGTRTTSSAALQEADVGVAMGFGAVKWQERVPTSFNILKYIQLELTMIISGTLITFITTVSLVDVPITAIQLILANFIVNLVGGFALLSEPPTDELMNNPPISPTETFIPKSMWRNIATQTLYQTSILVSFTEISHILVDYARLNKTQWGLCLLMGFVSLPIDSAVKLTTSFFKIYPLLPNIVGSTSFTASVPAYSKSRVTSSLEAIRAGENS